MHFTQKSINTRGQNDISIHLRYHTYSLPYHHPTRRTVPRKFLDNAFTPKNKATKPPTCVPAGYASTGYGQHQTIRIGQKGAGTRNNYPCIVYIPPPPAFSAQEPGGTTVLLALIQALAGFSICSRCTRRRPKLLPRVVEQNRRKPFSSNTSTTSSLAE